MSYIISFIKTLSLCMCFITLSDVLYAQGCPPNIDFEKGTLDHWTFSTGSCCPINAPIVSGPIPGRHQLMSGNGVDPYGGFPVVAPEGGLYSLKLGNSFINSEAERATYHIAVPTGPAKYVLIFRYAVVLQDANHPPEEQPRFDVKAYDSITGNIISCANYSFVASAQLPGFQLAPSTSDVIYKPWSAASIDLTDYKGRTVILDFGTGDCDLGAHFGYAYVDIDCESFNTNPITCAGPINTTLKAPPGFQGYEWRDATFTNVIGNTETITIPTPLQTTNYYAIIFPYPGYGCPDTIPLKVTVSNVQLTMPKDTTACNGSNVELGVQVFNTFAKPFKYEWTPATGLSCTNCQYPIANLQESITYMVTVTDTNGCIKSDTMRVNRVKQVGARISKPADTVCQYSWITLKDIATNPASAAHFWNLDTNGHIYSGDGSSTIVGWWGTPGIRQIIVNTSDAFCNISDTTSIYVRPGPYAHFDMKPDICLNEVLDIRPVSQDAWYYWSIEGKTEADTNFKTPIKISYNTLGRKRVALTVKGFNGCNPPPYDTVVTVHEYPVSDIYVSEKEVCYGDTVTLNTIKNNKYIYGWTPVHSFVTNSESSVRAWIERPQMVWLEVSNEWGCRIYDSAFVMPEHCCNVYFPDAFTPNNDGLNDRFKPITVGHHKIHSFMIANRWGKILYNSTDQYQGWDGTYKGEKQDYGMYFYYLKYDCTDAESIETKGSFLLIR